MNMAVMPVRPGRNTQVTAPLMIDSTEYPVIEEALERIARHMKEDRDKNLVLKNDKGVTVNRWNTTALLASSAASNESGYLTVKVARGLGMVALDTQARI